MQDTKRSCESFCVNVQESVKDDDSTPGSLEHMSDRENQYIYIWRLITSIVVSNTILIPEITILAL